MAAKTTLLGLTFLLALGGCRDIVESDPDGPIVRGGMPENEYADQTFVGADLGQYEGRRVLIRIGGPEPVYFRRERTASGTALIERGAFRLFFPSACEVDLYKPFVGFIDMDGDGSCTVGADAGFHNALGGGLTTYTVEPWQLFPIERSNCEFYHGDWME